MEQKANTKPFAILNPNSSYVQETEGGSLIFLTNFMTIQITSMLLLTIYCEKILHMESYRFSSLLS